MSTCSFNAIVLALAGALVIASAPIDVAEATTSKKVRRACAGDAKRLCPRNKFDSPELRYCMEAKARSLSSTCVRALEDDGVVPRGILRR
jgi:hypothetical protein